MNTQPDSDSDTNKNEISDSNQEVTPKTPEEKPTADVFTPENQPTATPPADEPKATAPTPEPPVATPETPATPPPSQPPPAQSPPAQIDTGQYDIASQQQPANQPKNGHPAVVITIVAILFLGLGFGGGFYGYKYIPQLRKLLSTSADTSSNSGTTAQTNSALKTYTNTKYNYSIEYPGDWNLTPANDTQAKTVQFTSYTPATTNSSTGKKVEVVFQDANGKTLKNWVAANNVTAGISATPTTITVDGQEALQEKTSGTSKSINTYILRDTQVMIISYSAPDSEFSAGEITYDQMVQSIKFQ